MPTLLIKEKTMKCYRCLLISVVLLTLNLSHEVTAVDIINGTDSNTVSPVFQQGSVSIVCPIDDMDRPHSQEEESSALADTYNNRRIVFVHTDLLGSPVAETDINGEELK